jgi:hypothetical protein
LDNYLEIAHTILRVERRPLTPRAILAAAYKAGIVSTHLHGKTQHKTLGARLSEDLVQRNDRSAFFRTAPGKYFLREFLADPTIPEEHRVPVPTRRRFRELVLGPALVFDSNTLSALVTENEPIDPEVILKLLQNNAYRYEDPRRRSPSTVVCRSFVCVHRDAKILSYRLGRYREDRDTFMNRRSIGFSTLVHEFENTLFSRVDLGIVDSGIRAAKVDLDIPELPADQQVKDQGAWLSHFLWVSGEGASDLIAVVCFECPAWFEPTRRRLALNDLQWLDGTKNVNNIHDFDPWSQKVLLSAATIQLCQRKHRGIRKTPDYPREFRG